MSRLDNFVSGNLPKVSVAEQLAGRIIALDAKKLPAAVRTKCEDLLVDVAGLCVTARNEDYVKAALAGLDDDVGSSRVDLQACKLEYSIVSPK